MSKELKDALRTMKELHEMPNEPPVIYLHSPDDGLPFAALVSLDLVEAIPEKVWDRMNHDHREGTEDEF